MMAKPLVAVPLHWEHAVALAPLITDQDTAECVAMGLTPLQALASGCMAGHGFAVLRRDSQQPVGAFGWADDTIWSLWGPMGFAESRQVVADTRDWVQALLALAERETLHNYALAESRRVLRYLRLSGAFEVAEPEHGWVRFHTRRAA